MSRRAITYLVCMAFLASAVVWAAPRPALHARRALRRTAVVLVAAQKAARKGGKYFGLARAVGHQLYARRQYTLGRYLDAIHHSLRARGLAVTVIELNKASRIKECDLDRIERNYERSSPPGSELDMRIEGENLGTDEGAAEIVIELEIE